MSAGHTPGPWKVAKKTNFVETATGSFIAECREQDARLIAAAPDLLAALQDIVTAQAEHYGDGMRLHMAMIDLADAARTAIKKVTAA